MNDARSTRSRVRDARRRRSVDARRDAMSSFSVMSASSSTRVAFVAKTTAARRARTTVAVKPRLVARGGGRGRVAVVAAAVDGASGSLANEVRASTRDARRCIRAR